MCGIFLPVLKKEKMKSYLLKLSMCLLCSVLYTVSFAQDLNLKKGDKYTIATLLSANMAIKRNDKQLNFSFKSAVTKSYHVTDANEMGYTIDVTTNHITDTIAAFDQKLAYSSDRAADPNSEIETGLSKMIGQTYLLSLDKSSKIVKVNDAEKAMADMKVAASAALYHKPLATGNFLNFGANFKLPAAAKKGTVWTDSATNGQLKLKTTYTIDEIQPTFTKILFRGTEIQAGINSNVNGALILENSTGVVLRRVLNIVTISKVTVGDKSFLAARKTLVSEICLKEK
jgi:hypothetical protein